MDVPEGYENFVEQALIRQFKLYGANPPDSKTLECLKKLALFLITDQGRNATTLAAITAAHVIVPNYLNDDWVFHDLFIDAVNKCLAGEEAMLGPNLLEAAAKYLGVA